MADLNEVRKYLMRAAKEASSRAVKARAESDNIRIEADRYEQEAAALSTAAQAIEQFVPNMLGSPRDMDAKFIGGGVAQLAGRMSATEAQQNLASGFVPVQRTEAPAPWDRENGPIDPTVDRG